MNVCSQCGAEISADENFCGVCGAPQQRDESDLSSAPLAPESASPPANLENTADGITTLDPEDPSYGITTLNKHEGEPSATPTAHGTGEVGVEELSSRTSRVGTGSGRRSKPKALAGGKVLNNRYEIVRRIGGGGMGAVYLAKDRNLGDAPRAVKEMIESHIDDSQHEKAIADFKRESLLLTELEHPSIPTVYDYFYDDQSERFYLVMKFIPGSDLSSRLRYAPGGRVDEPTVTEWGIQVADVLHYLHTRPQPII